MSEVCSGEQTFAQLRTGLTGNTQSVWSGAVLLQLIPRWKITRDTFSETLPLTIACKWTPHHNQPSLKTCSCPMGTGDQNQNLVCPSVPWCCLVWQISVSLYCSAANLSQSDSRLISSGTLRLRSAHDTTDKWLQWESVKKWNKEWQRKRKEERKLTNKSIFTIVL